MWAFLSKRFRMWLILAVAAPVIGWLLGKIGDLIEKRRGPNAFSRTLHQGRGWLQRRTKGPLSAKPDSERPAR
ncbi:hypothetical protein [Pseudonocardia sp. T1-2H]|uniref:hypothetical protein n=1 Tax=Pseudonocardia sp. T1-2H TaxID=3128899 RepID=UPI003100B6A4